MHAHTPCVGRGGQGECSYLPQASPNSGRGSYRNHQHCRAFKNQRCSSRKRAVDESLYSCAADAALHCSCQKPWLSRRGRDPALRQACTVHAEGNNRLSARCTATVAGSETSPTAVSGQDVRVKEQPGADRPALSGTNGRGINGGHEHNGHNGLGDRDSSGASLAEADSGPVVVAPEDFTLEPGQLSAIDRDSPCHPADVFRCTACTEPACQV